MNNYIEKLHVKDFRNFKSLDLEFNKKFNFIAGPNGCGKTSILAAISHCFALNSYAYSRFESNAEFWVDVMSHGKPFRVGLGKNSFLTLGYRANTIKQWSSPDESESRKVFATSSNERELSEFVPLFIGAQRSIRYKKIGGLNREDNKDINIKNYLSASTKFLYGDTETNVKQWLINRYFMIDKEWAREEAENWKHLISGLPKIGPLDSNFRYCRTERDLEPIFSIYGAECYLEELSAGFQSILLVIANIFEWVEGTRPIGQRNVKEAVGTVLIDELDVHLHPEWQFNIRAGLATLFPNLQFIVTTHSPHLLSSAEAGEIIVMRDTVSKHEAIVLKPTQRAYSGWSTDQILSEVMGVRSLHNKLHERLASSALSYLEQKKPIELRNCIEELKVISHPDDTIIVVLTAQLAALEAGVND